MQCFKKMMNPRRGRKIQTVGDGSQEKYRCTRQNFLAELSKNHIISRVIARAFGF